MSLPNQTIIESSPVIRPPTNVRPGSIPDTFTVTTTAMTPSTSVATRNIVLPRKEYARYEGPEFKDIKKDTVSTDFALREVFTSTPESRQEYVRERKEYNVAVEDYNKQALESIEAQKREIENYNKAVKEWNEKGRFQKQDVLISYYPSTTTIEKPGFTYKTYTKEIKTDMPVFIKASADKITQNLFSKAPELVGPVKPDTKIMPSAKQVIVGKIESYDPLQNVDNVYKRASFKYQEFIDKLSQKKYDSTVLGGAASSLAIIPVAGLKRGTDIISVLGDVSPRIDVKTGRVIPLKDRIEKTPISFVPGEQTSTVNLTRGERVFYSFKKNPEQLLGEVAFDVATIPIITKISSTVQAKQIRLTSEFIAPEKVFDLGVLQGKTTFPLQKSARLSDKIKDFKSSYEIIQGKKLYPTLHATDFSSRITQVNPPMTTNKAGKLLEDPVFYVAPYGRGSPYFLRLQDSTTLPKFSLDFTNFQVSSPKLYRPYVVDIKGLPKSVMQKKGYEPVLEFGKTARKDIAYITKRSSIATKEIEAGILKETVFEPLKRKALLSPYKGQSYYTIYKGKTIPILDVQATNRTLTNSLDDVINFSKSFSSKSGKITQSQINKLYQSYYLQASQPTMIVSPSIVVPSSSFRNLNNFTSLSLISKSSRPSTLSSYKSIINGVSNVSNYINTSISSTNKIIESSIITPTYDSSTTSVTTASSTTTLPTSYVPPIMTGYYLPTLPTIKTPPFKPPATPPYKKKKGFDRSTEERPINLEDAWTAEYKSKGKWKPIKVDNKKRNFYAAKELGAYIVDNSAERSFRLKRIPGKADVIKNNQPLNLFKFYKPSKTGNPRLTGAYIEDTRYAIDSTGERKGITAKGLIELERKRVRDNFIKPINKKRGLKNKLF